MDEKYLDQKFSGLRDKIDASAKETREAIDKLRKEMNGRVRKLEINQGKIMVIAGLIAMAVPLILKYVF